MSTKKTFESFLNSMNENVDLYKVYKRVSGKYSLRKPSYWGDLFNQRASIPLKELSKYSSELDSLEVYTTKELGCHPDYPMQSNFKVQVPQVFVLYCNTERGELGEYYGMSILVNTEGATYPRYACGMPDFEPELHNFANGIPESYLNIVTTGAQMLHEKMIAEGQFSWMTQDTGDQIGSEPQNKIDVYMYDNQGNSWKERDYEGYGEFGGMDYYDLVATMNGYTEEDVKTMKGSFKELRQLGIDLAFGKIKTKDKKRKTLFPALVTDPRYNWKRHDFTQEAESDPNQSWYQEPEYDDYEDDYYESVKEAKKIKIKDIENAWDSSYGEDFEYEYGSVYVEIMGKYKGKITKDELAKLWDEKYGEDLQSEYDGFFDKLDENVSEAKFVKDFDKAVLDAETEKDVLKVYPKAEFYVGKMSHFFGELEPNLFFKAYYAKYYKQDTGKSIKGDFKITTVYSEKGSRYVNLHVEESAITENYEVIYSDGVSAMKKFRSEKQALDFMKKTISSNKKLRDIAVYKPGMHSTTQTELVVKFWGDGSYLDNVSKRDKDLAAKKLEESTLNEARSINKISKEFGETVNKMKDIVKVYVAAEEGSDEKSKLRQQLIDLTAKKKSLTKELDDAVAGKNKDVKLVITEGVMSNIHLMATDSKNWDDFLKKFKKDYKKVFQNTPDFMDWLYGMYKDMAPLKAGEKVEEKYNKKKLLKAIKNKDDMFIQLGDGTQLLVYNPDSNNDDNAEMWHDDVVFAIDQDGEEHEVKYSDIAGIGESVVNEAKSFSEKEIKATTEVVADAIAKVYKTKAKVIDFETLDKDGKIAGFYIHKATNKEGAPSRYWVTDSGEVVSAFRHDTYGDGVIAQVGDKLDSVAKTLKANESVVSESKIQIKRKYTDKHPAKTAGRSARVRNAMIEALSDGILTEEEFNNILKEKSIDSKRWMRRNSRFFMVSEEGIKLSKYGKRIFKEITNKQVVNLTLESFIKDIYNK